MSVEITESGAKKPHDPEGEANGSKPYITSNIDVAATLIALGHKFTGLKVTKPDGGGKPRVRFTFEHNLISEDLKKWFNGELLVDPRQLLNNLNNLRNLTFNKGFL
jgi:hypothetical protein